jgi:hypothetical protein
MTGCATGRPTRTSDGGEPQLTHDPGRGGFTSHTQTPDRKMCAYSGGPVDAALVGPDPPEPERGSGNALPR